MPFFKVKLVLSGRSLEVYRYQKPVLYGVTIPHLIRRKRSTKPTFKATNLYRARRNLRRLIITNSTQRPVFITLTFAEKITDLSAAASSFKNFVKRLNYQLKIELKYIAVPEIQYNREKTTGSGVWHFHVLAFNLPYVDDLKNKLLKLWGLGFTNYRVVFNDVRHVANYLSKYLTKKNFETRLYGRKKYYTSRGLIRPNQYVDPGQTDALLRTIDSSLPTYTKRIDLPEYYQSIEITHYLVPLSVLPLFRLLGS